MSDNYSQIPRGPKPSSSSPSCHRTGRAYLASTAPPRSPYPARPLGYNKPQHASSVTTQVAGANVAYNGSQQDLNLVHLNQTIHSVQAKLGINPEIDWEYYEYRSEDNVIFHYARAFVDGKDCEWSDWMKCKKQAKMAAAPYATRRLIKKYGVNPFPNSLYQS